MNLSDWLAIRGMIEGDKMKFGDTETGVGRPLTADEQRILGEMVEDQRRRRDARRAVIEAARHVLDTFRKDEAQGYRSKDRQFAIAILGKAFEQECGDEQ